MSIYVIYEISTNRVVDYVSTRALCYYLFKRNYNPEFYDWKVLDLNKALNSY